MIPERHHSAKPARRLRRILPLALALALLSGCGQGEAPRDSWQPERPITIVVPWPAGGSTDQVTRLVAGILAEELGQESEVWVRQDAPPEVVATMERLWRELIVGSEELSRYARENGAVVTPYFGEEARRRTFESVKADAWALHELGRSAVSPETLGIPRP